MGTSQYLEIEGEDVRHGEDEGRREIFTEIKVVDEKTSVHSRITGIRRVLVLCSCGSAKCYAIDRFGLPSTTFHEQIEPIQPQSTRDQRALALRQGMK